MNWYQKVIDQTFWNCVTTANQTYLKFTKELSLINGSRVMKWRPLNGYDNEFKDRLQDKMII